jgi:transglutaminase-like putative cysteine protease
MSDRLNRDQLRWLLASLGLVFGLQATHLPVWVTLLAITAGAWRFAASSGVFRMPRTRWLLAIAALVIFGIKFSHGNLFGRDASVSLLASMMALKLLESHTRRDGMLLVFLSFFLGITSFLYAQSLLVGAYLMLPIVALTATMVGLNHPNGTLSIRPKLQMAGLMLAQSAPLMLLLFLLFPRIPGPLWGVPQDSASGLTGLSDSMSPGSISQLSRSDSIAFRVEFKGPIPALPQLYWRGPVFWQFNGTTWSSAENTRTLPAPTLDGLGHPVEYTVTLEPHDRHWMFMLDLPEHAPPDSILQHDFQLRAKQPVHVRMRYSGTSFLDYRMGQSLDDASRQAALQLPARSNPRAIALGKALSDAQATNADIVQKALQFYREHSFRYTLTPPLLGENAVDDFLFVTRSGFCEHYAGSFVFLMRAAGVPARVVTGYQGGEINPVGHYLSVRQADAHAWAEVWMDGRGWVRIDPTAAVAPQRVESGVATALPSGEPVATMMRGDLRWLRQLYLRWDAINNGWNQWVLGYDEKRQMQLLSDLAGHEISWQDMIIALMVSVAAVVLAVYASLLRRRQRADPLQDSYRRWLRKLARTGLKPEPHEGPLTFGQRVAIALPGQAQTIITISHQYVRLRYDVRPSALDVETFRQQVRKFKL